MWPSSDDGLLGQSDFSDSCFIGERVFAPIPCEVHVESTTSDSLLVIRFRINMVKACSGSLLGLLSERDRCVPVSRILMSFFISFSNGASLSIVDCNREPSQDCQRVLLFRGLCVAAGEEEEESLTPGIVFNFSLKP